ncbi:MAG: cation diffusion facilitator family transporter [Prevotellaceae bacterium]|nr:cation diffusion facilitator family transporter [Prevotellaceae bacterium]MDY3856894.1 cation diffusion facilitator family transporter [Bacteroidaceae bacterium]
MQTADREQRIYRVTLAGSGINLLLVAFKMVAGIMGASAAMIADAVHSLSDLLTDFVVLIFVRISSRPQDKDHDYGHGKYETLATALIGISLLGVGAMICLNGLEKIYDVWQGYHLASPGWIALVAAIVSVGMKEWAYRFTAKVGYEVGSQAVVANAWHHRSDALSSIGTALGVGGAILLGEGWTVLDPLAAVCVSFFIIRTSYELIRQSVDELLEKSLPEQTEQEIVAIAESEPEVSEVHNLRTRRIGSHVAIEMHLRMPGAISLYASHLHATHIEQRLRERFGASTHIGIHVEPVKVNGVYSPPLSSGNEA